MYSLWSSFTACEAKNATTSWPSETACIAQANPTAHLRGSTSGSVANITKYFLLILYLQLLNEIKKRNLLQMQH